MAYFIASIVFIIGFIAFIFSHVLFEQEMGDIYSLCTFPIVLFLTAWTFIKIYKKKKKPVKIVTLASSDISKYAKKDFTKVFSQSFMKESGITAVYITASKLNSYDYSVLIDNDSYASLDQKKLIKRIKNRFYDADRIKIIEYNNQSIANLFSIKLNE